jgi:hypothetical protein
MIRMKKSPALNQIFPRTLETCTGSEQGTEPEELIAPDEAGNEGVAGCGGAGRVIGTKR